MLIVFLLIWIFLSLNDFFFVKKNQKNIWGDMKHTVDLLQSGIVRRVSFIFISFSRTTGPMFTKFGM